MNMMSPVNVSQKPTLLISAGIISFAAAIWHLLCILGGPSWFAFARAPQQIIASSVQGTWLAPIGTIMVAGLMFACAIFAFSAAGLMRKVPLTMPALMTIATLCILRGLSAIPNFVTNSGPDIWQIVASTVWFYVGVCFTIGCINYRRKIKTEHQEK